MRVELFGVPRARVGRSELDRPAATLGVLLQGLAAEFPALGDLMASDRLHPALAASINGDRFIRDLATPLREQDCLLILSADAGG